MSAAIGGPSLSWLVEMSRGAISTVQGRRHAKPEEKPRGRHQSLRENKVEAA